MANYDLSFNSVSIPNNSGGITVTVEEDPLQSFINSDSKGVLTTSKGAFIKKVEPENIDETITLSDGITSYSTSSNSFIGGGKVNLSFNIGPPSDKTVSSYITFPVTVTLK